MMARWLEALPQWVTAVGPRGILWWEWLLLPLLFAAAGLAGNLLSRALQAIFWPAARRNSATWDDAVLARVRGPLAVVVTLGIVRATTPWLGLSEPADQLTDTVTRGLFLANLFWALARVIDVAALVVARSPLNAQRPGLSSLVTLAGRIGKFLVLALAVIAFLSELGYPVTSLIAGLGIGGLAFALAAQKTVENLFGALSLGADQPFQVGDFVRVEDFVGTVERIGLRSTRIRTLDRTLITMPNGKLAEMRLESFSARDRIRLFCTLGLVYETRAEQVRTIVSEVERTLRAHPLIWPNAVSVRFTSLGESSLNVEVTCWFMTPDWDEFQLIRQEMLLAFMGIVEAAGTTFAFPTRTIHVASSAGPGAPA